jgi:hypothetical protein
MKSKPLLVVFMVCFSLFLFMGIKASQSMFSEDDIPSARPLTTTGPLLLQEETEGEPVPEPFTLIILVDDLASPSPLLEGVWLTTPGENPSARLFFPVFPSQADDGVQRDLNLRGAFWFEDRLQPSQQFLTILRDRNLSWDRLLFLDYSALNEVGLILHEINNDYVPLNSIGLAGLSYTVENRLGVQTNQALFIREICGQLPLKGQNELMQHFLEGFSSHLGISGTTPLIFYQNWQSTSYCYFPTLTLPGD